MPCRDNFAHAYAKNADAAFQYIKGNCGAPGVLSSGRITPSSSMLVRVSGERLLRISSICSTSNVNVSS